MEENQIVIEFENSDTPEEVAAARKQREQFDRNSAWLQAHILEIGDSCRGKCICIAGQELFAGDTIREVVAQATAAHPEDSGWFTQYIPKKKVARILNLFAVIVDRAADRVMLLHGADRYSILRRA